MSRQRSLIFWPIPLRKDREHSWKHHCRSGLTRELLGWIDVMASRKEAETGVRFVFAKRETLLTKCFKGKRSEGKHYSLAQLKRSLDELREQHIISRYKETGDGHVGFVVAPHDSLCRVEKDGKTCLLVDRSAWHFVNERPDWRNKVLDAVKESRARASNRAHDEPQSEPIMSPNQSPASLIEEPQSEPQSEPGESLYLSNLALLSDEEKADWFANGMQDGSPTRVTRLSEVADEPMNPFYPRAQDELKRHDEFLKRHAEKQQQKQDQAQDQKQDRSLSKPLNQNRRTEEATATPTPQGRKRPVLTPSEYADQRFVADLERSQSDTERRIAEMIAALPTCTKCGAKHPASMTTCPKK
jgi:hypothetical protein